MQNQTHQNPDPFRLIVRPTRQTAHFSRPYRCRAERALAEAESLGLAFPDCDISEASRHSEWGFGPDARQTLALT